MSVLRHSVPVDAGDAQRRASDPAASAWVSAHAGSGKTHVLTERVIRLLLAGVPPHRILCLTYTKAAAANMANRVFRTLARWATMPDDALRQALTATEGKAPGDGTMLTARRLFARALEVPGGLKMQTIHAFCERLLHQFPFEAGVPASFKVLDERAGATLLAEAKGEVLRRAAQRPSSRIGRALETIAIIAGETSFDSLVGEIVAEREALAAWLGAEGGADVALAGLAKRLGLAPGTGLAAVEAEIMASPHVPETHWMTAIDAFRAGGANDAKQATRLEAARLAAGKARLEAYLSVFFTDKGSPRASVCGKAVRAALGPLAEALDAEKERLAPLAEQRRAAALLEATRALAAVADAILERYAFAKRARGLLDFDDLIVLAERLLGRTGISWVLYKLDGGIDHILVDEAQDTSPPQWQVIAALAAEFFAGEGARAGLTRTLFAVGDEKQSIFSFQGADPEKFDAMRAHFRRRADAAKAGFATVPLRYSFRSTPDVLAAVDTVFATAEQRRGLSHDLDFPGHEAVRTGDPGFVELWPVVLPEAADDELAWDAPLDAVSEVSPPVVLARRIAAEVKGWIGREHLADGAPIGAGDVVVLVRTRNALFEALIRALKQAGVPVAGADRLKLAEHIAVMDCLAAIEFVLLPDDDLTLAALLKSPLIGLDEDALYTLAHDRRFTLWQALRESDDPVFAAARARLSRWLDRADFVRPFGFLAELLGAEGGRARFHARLGAEADDALDELLKLALAYEEDEAPSLQGFLAWLRAVPAEAVRSLGEARGEVRVMTVHNAKGLEAPVVILADTCSAPDGRHDPRLVTLGTEPGAPLCWRVGRDEPQPIAEARQRLKDASRAEHRRLLYVALTRARDRLYVCGCQGARGRPDGNWYDLVADALRPGAVELLGPDGEVSGWRWSVTPPRGIEKREPEAAPPPPAAPPAWLGRPAARERAARPLAPSSVLAALEAEGERDTSPIERLAVAGSPGASWALERGRLVHKLLQLLPEVGPGERLATARSFLARMAPSREAAERDALLGEVLALFEDSAFAPVFAAGSRAEVSVAGLIAIDGVETPVSGQIDRLAVTERAVLIVDYKTNRAVPGDLDAVPPAYLAQLAAYRALLVRLYPGREVAAALLWTAAPRLMPVPQPRLDRMLGMVAP